MNFVTNVLKKYMQNEPQEATAKEPEPEIVTSSDKENTLIGKAEPYNPKKDLDAGCGSRPKRTNLRVSFLRAFDPLYESPKKPTATEEQLLTPRVRQQLVIEDSDDSDSSQLAVLVELSDEETVYVDAADFNEPSNIQIGENKQLHLDDTEFYTPEKLNTTSLQDSEKTPKPTSQLADGESVLPKIIEPVSTSESNLPHVEKRKLHSNNAAEQKVHSPVVVPCKKQRITEREIVEAIRFKLQLDRSDEEETVGKETDQDFKNKEDILNSDAEISSVVEGDDSNSEISDIKTDSPEKSIKDTNLGSEVADEQYPELPETSDESTAEPLISKTLEEGKIIPTSTEKDLILQACNLENYPDLPETSDESSADQLPNKTYVNVPKAAEEKAGSTSTQRDVFLEACNLEQYPDLPETSDESSADHPLNKTDVNVPKTAEEKASSTSTQRDVFLQACNLEQYPDLPETSDESSADQLPNKTYLNVPKTVEEKTTSTSTQRDVFLEACNLEQYPDLPETSDESTAEILANKTFDEAPKKTISTSANRDVVLQSCNVEEYPDLPETSDESSTEQLINKTSGEVLKTTEEKIIAKPTDQDVVLQDCNLDKHLNVLETSDELVKNRTFEISPRTTEEERVAVKEIHVPIFEVEEYPDLPETSDESAEDPLVNQTVVGTPKITKAETVKETVQLLDSSEDISKVIGESSKSDENTESSKELSQENIEVEKSKKEDFTLPEEKRTDITSSSKKKLSLESTEEESSAEKLEQVFPIQSDESTLISTEEELFDKKAKKDLINSSTKLQTRLDTEEEHKSEQEVEENTNTSFVPHKPAEKDPLDSGVSSEDSYCKSPESAVTKTEKRSDYEKNFAEERTVESDGQVTSDDDTDSTVQNDQTDLVTQSNGKIKTEESQENLNTNKGKSEADSGKSITKKIDFDVEAFKSKMADLSEQLSEQQKENSDLKLQLNASQQAKASLELEIRQKEEIIIKTEAEAMKNEQLYKQEIKQLKEKLKENNSKLIEKDSSKDLEEQLKEAKTKEAKAVAELNQLDFDYQKIMEEYDNTLATRYADYKKLMEDHNTATHHLGNIEFAFSDLHQKYERAKTIIQGFKSNEDLLKLDLQSCEKVSKQHEDRYESLKAHATAQLEKANKEILMLRDKYEMDIKKLKAIIKRLEIKCGSLEVSLQQKHEECAALSALCDEVTGKRM